MRFWHKPTFTAGDIWHEERQLIRHYLSVLEKNKAKSIRIKIPSRTLRNTPINNKEGENARSAVLVCNYPRPPPPSNSSELPSLVHSSQQKHLHNKKSSGLVGVSHLCTNIPKEILHQYSLIVCFLNVGKCCGKLPDGQLTLY